MKAESGDPAFPTIARFLEYRDEEGNQGADILGAEGMTLRQYYAGLALQGLLANQYRNNLEMIAEDAVKAADNLIDELNKGKSKE